MAKEDVCNSVSESTGAYNVQLNDGTTIPRVGLGVYRASPQDTYTAVSEALRIGYRHIDTAQFYQNEADVGRAVADSGLSRDDVWITSKIATPRLRENTASAVVASGQASVAELGTHIDLLLLHTPHTATPPERLDWWRGMEQLRAAGVVRSIGVSNYGVHHMKELVDAHQAGLISTLPSINQVEIHPFLLRDDIEAYASDNSIAIQAYSPLAKAARLNDPTVTAIAEKHSVSPAQVMIRWSLQRGYIPLPKSVTPSRIASNIDVFDFELSDHDMGELNGLDSHMVTGWDPTVAP